MTSHSSSPRIFFFFNAGDFKGNLKQHKKGKARICIYIDINKHHECYSDKYIIFDVSPYYNKVCLI